MPKSVREWTFLQSRGGDVKYSLLPYVLETKTGQHLERKEGGLYIVGWKKGGKVFSVHSLYCYLSQLNIKKKLIFLIYEDKFSEKSDCNTAAAAMYDSLSFFILTFLFFGYSVAHLFFPFFSNGETCAERSSFFFWPQREKWLSEWGSWKKTFPLFFLFWLGLYLLLGKGQKGKHIINLSSAIDQRHKIKS